MEDGEHPPSPKLRRTRSAFAEPAEAGKATADRVDKKWEAEMRKTTSRIAKLPEAMRTEINRKLQEGWMYKMIREWLFEQTAGQDVPALDLKAGDSYSLVWARTAKTADHAGDACEQALSNWYCKSFPVWVKEQQASRDESLRVVERAEQLGKLAGEKKGPGFDEGSDILIRTMLLDAVERVLKDGNNPADVVALANAWSRMTSGKS
jgi:hypothetical protein